MKLANVKNVTVLGTGMMGPGIALLFARAGYKTTIWGLNEEEVANGHKNFKCNIDDLVQQKIISEKVAKEIQANIEITCDLEKAVSDTDFVSEAIIENLEIKQDIFAQMEYYCPHNAVLTSNTSTLLPSDLNKKMKTKSRMLVAHFWNPAHLAPLVEVCGSPDTSQEAVDLTMDILKKIGNEPVLMKKEILGFIGNRIMHAMNREALSLIEQGVVTAEEVDKVVLASFGPRFSNLGPMEYLDFCGLDHIRRIQDYLYEDLAITQGIHDIIEDKVESRQLGCKTGKGLIDWTGKDVDGPRKRRDMEFIRRLKGRDE